jgi:hypothetical protein
MKVGLLAGLSALAESSDIGSHSSLKAATTSNYNRAKALAYARKYCNKICSHGYISIDRITTSPPIPYLAIPAGTTFVQKYANGQFQDEWIKTPAGTLIQLSARAPQLDDCTHFVSCCLGSPPNATAGGLHIHRDYNTIYGCLGADRLFNQLKADRLIHVVAERQTFSQATSHIGSLQAGDLIFYCTNALPYHHSALYMADSMKRISCHSYCHSDVTNNFSQTWDDISSYNRCSLAKVL